MPVITRIALGFVGIVFIVYETVLRIFLVVCAIFAIYVMLGLMIEWTAAIFRTKAASTKTA